MPTRKAMPTTRRCSKIRRWRHRVGSSPTTGTTSEQSPLCSDVFLCLRQKRRQPPAPLLLLSKSNPLRRVSIWRGGGLLKKHICPIEAESKRHPKGCLLLSGAGFTCGGSSGLYSPDDFLVYTLLRNGASHIVYEQAARTGCLLANAGPHPPHGRFESGHLLSPSR